jgi:cytochrome c oxidase subunit 2
VLHSFWIPALAGKRDLIANHTNYLWFTADSTPGTSVWNGHCAEYCGASHANMKFRVYTVTPTEFSSWVAGQRQVAAVGGTPTAGQSSGPQTLGAPAAAAATALQAGAQPPARGPNSGEPALPADAAARSQTAPTQNSQAAAVGGTTGGTVAQGGAPGGAQGGEAGVAPGYTFPTANLPAHIRPSTPISRKIAPISDAVLASGNAERGRQIYSSQSCIGCHYVNGNPASIGKIGPNLTHFGSRNTLGAGLFPNDAKHLAYWIKNTREMKPGVTMPTLGLNETDPVTKRKVTAGGLTDQQIADIVAYLQALK